MLSKFNKPHTPFSALGGDVSNYIKVRLRARYARRRRTVKPAIHRTDATARKLGAVAAFWISVASAAVAAAIKLEAEFFLRSIAVACRRILSDFSVTLRASSGVLRLTYYRFRVLLRRVCRIGRQAAFGYN